MILLIEPPAHTLFRDELTEMHRLRCRVFKERLAWSVTTEGDLEIDNFGRRLRIVLQALDGWLAGASHRDISCALFGDKRTKADWTDPSGHLRDTTRRAVRRGRLLMNGGYKALLGQL